MSLILDGTNGITNLTSINGGQLGGRRNIVYNGEMKVAQRSTSETGLGAAAGYFTLDRWKMQLPSSQAGRFTMAQVADGPAGFANCLKLSCTTADTSIAAGEALFIRQPLEGQDLQQLQKGTATAKQLTVSFYVKGNASATYTCELKDQDNTRTINQEFAVTTSWNRIELTFAADTSDPLDDDNAVSLDLHIWLHAGSTYSGGTFVSNTWKDQVENTRVSDSQTSIFDATSRTFFITGVQMEIGATATEFEHRSFGEELALCQRYYERITSVGAGANYMTFVSGFNTSTTVTQSTLAYVKKRTTPTIAFAAAAQFRITHTNTATACSAISASQIGDARAIVDATVGSAALTAGQGSAVTANNNTTAYIEVISEL
jgi:hypothetical protein